MLASLIPSARNIYVPGRERRPEVSPETLARIIEQAITGISQASKHNPPSISQALVDGTHTNALSPSETETSPSNLHCDVHIDSDQSSVSHHSSTKTC